MVYLVPMLEGHQLATMVISMLNDVKLSGMTMHHLGITSHSRRIADLKEAGIQMHEDTFRITKPGNRKVSWKAWSFITNEQRREAMTIAFKKNWIKMTSSQPKVQASHLCYAISDATKNELLTLAQP